MLRHQLCRLLLGSVLGWLILVTVSVAQELTVTHFTQVSSRRVSPYEFEYTLRADIVNTGPAVKNVGATVSGKPAYVAIVDGALTFGEVATGATVTSQDTFILRLDRRYQLQPTDLVWNISAEPLQNLIAHFRAVPSTGNAPLQVRFYPEPVTDTAIQQFQWDRDGNGTFEISDPIGNSQTFTYTQPGTYRPALRVTDARGAQDTQTLTLTVGNAPPVVTGQLNPTNGQVPLTVSFSATATDNEGIATYEWDFQGDGTYDFSSTSTATTTYTYTTTGTYRPVLRVTDRQGASTLFVAPSTEVRAAPTGSPTVTPSASPRSGNVPLSVNFSGSFNDPQGKPASQWRWDFDGDGSYDYSSASSATTAHTYAAAGLYYPRLQLTLTDGRSAEGVLAITVNPQNTLRLDTDTLDTAAGGKVTVTTTLGGNSRVSVIVQDRLGQTVKTLLSWTDRPAGSYSDRWDGTTDAGGTAAEGPYYAVLLYELNGQVNRLDLSLTTGGQQYNPSRTGIPSSFSPFAGQPLTIDFTLTRASETTAFMGSYNTNTRYVTFLQRQPLGRGTHRLIWNGENNDGQLIQPPLGDQFLFGIFGYYFPDNGIYVRSGAHLTNLAISPSIFNPAGQVDNQGTPERSALTFTLNKPANVELVVNDAESGAYITRRFFTGLVAGSNTVHWDGRNDQGQWVAPGRYRLGLAAVDSTGYRSLLLYGLQRVYY
jgi:PKD repeat protein